MVQANALMIQCLSWFGVSQFCFLRHSYLLPRVFPQKPEEQALSSTVSLPFPINYTGIERRTSE